MNITRENTDALNAVVKVEISATDYREKVDKVLTDYRKKANIPGFRKGHIPMGMIKKQYGKSIMIDEVNKLLQTSLNDYLIAEKLDILGNPLPKVQEDFDWETEDYCFEFELGLSPVFEVKLDAKKKVTRYDIVVDEALLDKEVENLQKRYGKLLSKDEVAEGVSMVATFANEEKEIEKKSTVALDQFKGKSNLKKLTGQKVGAVLSLSTKGLFVDDHTLMDVLGMGHEEVQGLKIPLTMTIEEINMTEPAEINQELFDKLFGPGNVSSEAELREKIKADAAQQFQSQADQHLLNAVTEYLVDNTRFDLPADFLKRWIAVSGEKTMSPEQALEEYEKSEKGLRYQLIEGKIMKEHNLQVNFEELQAFAREFVKAQMAQYGQLDPDEKTLDDIVQRVMSNEQEVKRMQEQLVSK
ncbi:MAG: trigger factor, partial [Lutibacter sp.]|nr:trigger factor [Lutibacter sp.]